MGLRKELIRPITNLTLNFRWTREEAILYISNYTSYSRPEIENQVDRYITLPGQACAYKIGELKIWDLRHEAEKELGRLCMLLSFPSTINAPVLIHSCGGICLREVVIYHPGHKYTSIINVVKSLKPVFQQHADCRFLSVSSHDSTGCCHTGEIFLSMVKNPSN